MICIGLLLAVASAAAAIAGSVPFNKTEIIEEIDAVFKCHDNPALAVSVVSDSKTLLSKGFGIINMISKEPVTNTTIFGIASLSKSFAASLLIKLLHENTNLTVDSQIHELLGNEFKMPDDLRTLETTFADIMAHRTGIPPHNFIRFDSRLNRETLIRRLPLLSANPRHFRTKYYYSNIMYGLVTRLAELIGDDRWENLISKHLFQPLEMNSSTFATVIDFDRSDVAVPYEKKKGVLSKVHAEFSKLWAELAGSGSVMTNAEDMARWMNFHLNNGKNMYGRQVMSSALLREVQKSQFLVNEGADKNIRIPEFPITSSGEIYTFGFTKGFYRGFEHLSHSGSTQGYRAYLSLLPTQKIGVFMVVTGDDANLAYRAPQVMYLMDRALGLEPWLNTSTICSFPYPWKVNPKPSNLDVFDTNQTLTQKPEQYEGTYYNSAHGHLRVHYNFTELTLIMTYGWGKWQLLRLASSTNDTEEKYYGQAMEITQLNINSLHFQTMIKDNVYIITGLQVSGFEPNVPPTFEKLLRNVNSVCQGQVHLVVITAVFSCCLHNLKS